METETLRALIRKRHPGEGWLVLDEVQDSTGMDAGRRIDVFALALWPSLEYLRVAYEIKLNRGDWLKELKTPEKRNTFHRLSHEAWFVLGPDVLLPGERRAAVQWHKERQPGGNYGRELEEPLPFEPAGLWTHEQLSGWGILELQENGKLKVIIRAVKRQAWPLPNSFAAALLARAAKRPWQEPLPATETAALSLAELERGESAHTFYKQLVEDAKEED